MHSIQPASGPPGPVAPSRPSARGFRALLAVLLALLAAGPLASGARAAATPLELSREMAAPWPGLQHTDGSFPDYVFGGNRGVDTRYGESMLGYALLQAGIRDGDKRAVRAGLKGVNYAVRHPNFKRPSVFEHLAVAASYNLARRRLRSEPGFRSNKRRWERFMRRIPFVNFGSGRRYFNHYLVEAVALLELLKTGQRSRKPGTVLYARLRARRHAKRLVNQDLPRITREFAQDHGKLGRLALLPDPPRNPVAYHGLSMGYLARAIELLGRRAEPRSRALLRQAASASLAITAPDGDLAYTGRSQEQAWALSFAAYGLEVASRQRGVGRNRAGRYRALADRLMGRLETEHGTTSRGHLMTPALRQDFEQGRKGLDSYAGAVVFGALTLVATNWAVDERRHGGKRNGRLDVPDTFALGAGVSSFAVVRQRDIWFAVKRQPGSKDDLRYDFGLVALKTRDPGDGRWRDILRLRPKTPRGTPESVGPRLGLGNALGFPFGDPLRVSQGGTVSLRVGFRTGGGQWIRRGVPFKFQPIGCGVRMSFPAQRGDRYEFSAFFPEGGGGPTLEPRQIFDGRQLVQFSEVADTLLEPDYSSGADARLVRARSGLRTPEGGEFAVNFCDRGR